MIIIKGLTKEHLIEAINVNYQNGECICQNDITLTEIFNKLGDDWFIMDGILECTKNSSVTWNK